MVGIILITFIVTLVLAILVVFDPKFDTIVVRGKKRRILWYNDKDGRNWVLL